MYYDVFLKQPFNSAAGLHGKKIHFDRVHFTLVEDLVSSVGSRLLELN